SAYPLRKSKRSRERSSFGWRALKTAKRKIKVGSKFRVLLKILFKKTDARELLVVVGCRLVFSLGYCNENEKLFAIFM
ncbi:hypothetical protein, partial [Fibrobacter intestinalis]|uniref:hypothetical protein n=1 Tax=Fibrobacter intestinalis TaxID=28122 RepID=UPI001F1E020A